MKALFAKAILPIWLRKSLLLALVFAAMAMEGRALLAPYSAPGSVKPSFKAHRAAVEAQTVARAVDADFAKSWAEQKVQPAAPADTLTIARRISLALTGSIPSLQEIRALEAKPEADRTEWWLTHLLDDRRSSDYLAERFTRVYVGTENGPFLAYRRRRLVEWVANRIHENRPYNETVRALIGGEGIWTTNPEVNFVTVTIQPKTGPDEARLAARVSRAFLGVRMDCVQCHDGKLNNPWKQTDFHQNATFFGGAKLTITVLHDNPKQHYEYRYLRTTETVSVPPVVPWKPELLPKDGTPRQRLAKWVTNDANRPFARAVVNRMWALLFNKPLITPVDDIPLTGPYPPGLEILADDFTAHHCDLRRLIRAIISTQVFQLASKSADPDHPLQADSAKQWASFPMTRLRPDQMAGSVIQSASLSTIDAEYEVLMRIKRDIDVTTFVKRYGDVGEDDFTDQSGTIPQRLLMMNGSMISNYTRNNPLFNTSTRLDYLAPDDATAVEAAYLTAFTRRPSKPEADYFTAKLHSSKGAARNRAMSDLCWTLLNSTEFSWNH